MSVFRFHIFLAGRVKITKNHPYTSPTVVSLVTIENLIISIFSQVPDHSVALDATNSSAAKCI